MLKEVNQQDQAWHMVICEGSNSRATRASSFARPIDVAYATSSTVIEAGEEFEESSNSELVDVFVALDDEFDE